MDHIKKEKRPLHPEETANPLSVIFFLYTLKLFKKGFKKDLEQEDLYEVLSSLKSEKLGNQLENQWEKQKKHRDRPSVFRLIWKCYGKKYLLLGCMQLTVNAITIIVQPRAQGKLVQYFAPGQTELTKYDAYFYAALLIGLNVITTIYNHNYYLIITTLGIRMRTAFSSFIYRKALKLSPTHLSDISVGKVVTLITKDVQVFEMFVSFANHIWIGLIKTIIICGLIYYKVGFAAVIGIGFLLLLMPIQIYFGIWAAKLRMKMCKRSDERLQLTQEVLSAIKIIKMYTWERFFENKISKARNREIASMHNIYYLRFIVLTIGQINAKISFYLLMMTYIWFGNQITAETVYFVQSCFQILSFTISTLFPMGIGQIGELFASTKRIGNVLKAMEIPSSFDKKTTDATIKPKIVFKDVCVDFKDKRVLNHIDLNLEMGTTLIGGSVGSGKTFLLKTILKDYQPKSGHVQVQGRISYASQEPWLFPSSIRQNILFGEEYDDERYQQILNVCALRYDFNILENGDQTIVEDRGMNLSKGQQARINLARAVYKDADIYLLDDCLSALDAQVTDFIFKECITKFLQNKLVILVTHNTKYAKQVDNVLIISHGTIKSFYKRDDLIVNELNRLDSRDGDKVLDDTLNDDDDDGDAIDNNNETTKLITTETTTQRIVYHEHKQEGAVDFTVHRKYMKFGGGLFVFFLVFMVFVGAQFFLSSIEKLVSRWVNIEQKIVIFTINNTTNTTEYEEIINDKNYTLKLYAVSLAIAGIFSFGRSFSLFLFARRASLNLHKYMIRNVVHATMHFFDTNFIGNILNRFSKDLSTIDDQIPFVFFHLFASILHQVGIIILIATVNTIFLIPVTIFFIVLVILRRLYLPTGRSLKRMDAITRSPVIGHLNATLEGLTTIRAFKAENIVQQEYDRHQDLYTSATYAMQCAMRAFGFFLDLSCSAFIATIIIRFLLTDKDTEAGNVGLAISQAFMMVGSLQWAIRQWAEVENQLTSVERVLEYTNVKQETNQGQIIDNWPLLGEIRYENVSLTYTNSTDRVLKNINFLVKPSEKIGIIGRTGAGKSSIISTLFRLYEVEGKITIDGVDTRTLSLSYLRSKISIIPQDPVLFTGTIRENIDPTGEYQDSDIWQAIELAHLTKLVPSLDFEITENGANFSVGQRQLICLARAIIRNNRIVVLDEATANMDQETDLLIHETIHKHLSNCTVFTVAHKLHSILNCDRVMVMDKGEIVQFDQPINLLKDKNGIFYRMVEKAGLLDERHQ